MTLKAEKQGLMAQRQQQALYSSLLWQTEPLTLTPYLPQPLPCLQNQAPGLYLTPKHAGWEVVTLASASLHFLFYDVSKSHSSPALQSCFNGSARKMSQKAL